MPPKNKKYIVRTAAEILGSGFALEEQNVYTVSWEEAGKEVSVDLTEAGALYVKKSRCEFLIYKQNDDNLNRNQRKIEYNKTNTQK